MPQEQPVEQSDSLFRLFAVKPRNKQKSIETLLSDEPLEFLPAEDEVVDLVLHLLRYFVFGEVFEHGI